MNNENEIEKLKQEIEHLKEQLRETERLKNEYLMLCQRERADFLNYKKEELSRLEELVKNAKETLLAKFLPILDNFEIAQKNIPKELQQNSVVEGFLNIKKQISEFLKSQGIEEIKTEGEKFNLAYHELIEEVSKEGVERGIIVEEVQKGYKIGERVLRPAKVKVAK